MIDAIVWLAAHLWGGVVNLVSFVVEPARWPDPSTMEGVLRIVHYGASVELLFVVLDIALVLLLLGLWRHGILWAVVRGIEGLNNAIGRIACWAALLMVLQQVMIVVLQRIFRVSEISVGPLGLVFTKDLSWFGEELKLYNAAIVTLCAAYTFVQGGHVRVDLIYAAVSHRKKRITDMVGALVFVLPFMTVIWLFAWYFLWRSLLSPPVAATDTLDKLLLKAQITRWNVETIGFSPNGFDAYFLFKVLLVAFAGLMFLQGLAHFWRSLLELLEGEEAADRHRNLDGAEAAPEPGETAAARSG